MIIDVGPCHSYRCGEAESPFCAECEQHHCAGCGHPATYTVLRYVERPCGCVYVQVRQVHTRLWRGRSETTETTHERPDPASRCAGHAEEARLQRKRRREIEAQWAREDRLRDLAQD